MILITDPITLPIKEGSIALIHSAHVQCVGFESSLSDCDEVWVDNFSCRSAGFEYSGVKCFDGKCSILVEIYMCKIVACVMHLYSKEPECQDGNVKLIDSNKPETSYKTVQYCIYGLWSSIGGNSWDDADAKVVCEQLGLLPLCKNAG